MFNQTADCTFYFWFKLRFPTFLLDKLSFPLIWKSDRMSEEIPQRPNHPLFFRWGIDSASCTQSVSQIIHMGWVCEHLQPSDGNQTDNSKFLALKGSCLYILRSPPVRVLSVSAASYSFTLTAPMDQLEVFVFFMPAKAQGKWILVKETLVNARNKKKKEEAHSCHLGWVVNGVWRGEVSSRCRIVWLAMGEICAPEIQANSVYNYPPSWCTYRKHLTVCGENYS